MISRLQKAFCVFILFVFFILISFPLDLFVRNRKRRLTYFSKTTSFFAGATLRVLEINVQVRNYERLSRTDKNYLILSNHLSYLDILVISSVTPALFIASIDEVKERFPLGIIAKFGGSVFIERRNRANLSNEIEAVSALLKEGFNVVLFPEGGTSDGEGVLFFKPSFIAPAVKSGVDILPVCLRYLRINGENINPANRRTVFYYGGATFFSHFFRLLSVRSVDVELVGLESIPINQNLSRKEAARLAFNSISSTLTPAR